MLSPRLARDSFGRPFVQETFLYHLSRLDHRHNFSPYFYPYYLAHSPPAAVELLSPSWFRSLARHPLAAFLPQLVLSIGLGFRYGVEDLPYAWLVQTFAFVTFNKVCTSQVRRPPAESSPPFRFFFDPDPERLIAVQYPSAVLFVVSVAPPCGAATHLHVMAPRSSRRHSLDRRPGTSHPLSLSLTDLSPFPSGC